jgi:uncharacterized protein (DUF58 family)
MTVRPVHEADMPTTALPSIATRRKTTLPLEGQCWLLAGIALWLTGWLKGINLILLLAYLLLLLWALNWLAARRALRGVIAVRHVRMPIFAGHPVSWGLDVTVEGRRPQTGWEVLDEGQDHAVRWLLVNTPPGEAAHLRRDVMLPHRGPYDCRPLRAVSSFPFGLVRQEVQFGGEQRLTVLPQLGQVNTGRLRRWLMHSARPDERARRSRRRLAFEAEFHGLRQFRPGDSPRWIHWRTSARTGELVVREFDHGTHHDLVLIVEPFGEDAGLVDDAVSLAATICWTWSKEAGDRVVLAIAGPEPRVCASGDSPASAIDLLEVLAAVRPTLRVDAGLVGRRLHERPLPPGPALLVSSRPDALTADELSDLLDRPVAYLNAAEPPSFYHPPK